MCSSLTATVHVYDCWVKVTGLKCSMVFIFVCYDKLNISIQANSAQQRAVVPLKLRVNNRLIHVGQYKILTIVMLHRENIELTCFV